MKELSLNILDIAENSVKAGASDITIYLKKNGNALSISIKDNGCGMKQDFLKNVTNPFSTTRTTRSVGLGLPFLKLAAEQTGGYMTISSVPIEEDSKNHGTETVALFYDDHIDAPPLGDIVSTIVTLIQGNADRHWIFHHEFENGEVVLDTAELKAVLGEVPLDTPDVLVWIKEYLEEQYGAI